MRRILKRLRVSMREMLMRLKLSARELLMRMSVREVLVRMREVFVIVMLVKSLKQEGRKIVKVKWRVRRNVNRMRMKHITDLKNMWKWKLQ
jgi:hypothetical protein